MPQPPDSPIRRTHEEERFRALFLQEQARARHLSLVNEIQKYALQVRDQNEFLQHVAHTLHRHFDECDAIIYLCENSQHLEIGASPPPSCDALVMSASAGLHNGEPLAEEEAEEIAPFAERALRQKHTQYQSRYAKTGFQSGTCVPILSSEHSLGVVCLKSRDADAIEERDTIALQTVAAIVASHLESSRLFNQMSELSAFNQTLIATMLHALMTVDEQGEIVLVNERLCHLTGCSREELLHQPLERVLGQGNLYSQTLRNAITDVTRTGTPYELPEVQLRSPAGLQVFDLRVFRVFFRGQAQAVILLIDITHRWRMLRQLQLLNEIGHLFGASLDINRVLHTVLTCVTAGAGLGFNRAFLLLRDEQSTPAAWLRGAMALGPSSAEEAGRIWRSLSTQELTLEELLDKSAPIVDRDNLTPLQSQTLELEIDLENPGFAALERIVNERRATLLKREEFIADSGNGPLDDANSHFFHQHKQVSELLTAPEVAIAPLVVKERVVGVIFADNLYSGAPITPDDIQLLDALAQRASLTVANALAYQALSTTQRELVNSERLAAVGEMAARVSHEIRNPLATIGGFARNISRKVEDTENTSHKIQVIVDEIERLEELLNDLIDISRQRPLNLQPYKLNSIVEHALLLADAEILAHKVQVVRELEPNLPPLVCDRARVLQAILNIARNGAQAMPEGGQLRVATRKSENEKYLQVIVQDNGKGISEQALKHVFDPFFSTKLKGGGLGLVVTRRIAEEHGGEIKVFSEAGEGTTFVLNWPLNR